MKYDDPTLREHLASMYALGHLRGQARARFERLLQDDAGLRARVVDYQETLTPLAMGAPDVAPPARVRARLVQATSRASASTVGFWQRVSVWRVLAAFNGVFAVLLVASLGLGLLRPAMDMPRELVYVGVLSDRQARPSVAILAYNHPFELKIESKLPLSLPAGREFRVWIRDRDSDAPVFLASIPQARKTLAIDDAAWARLRQAKALLVTESAADDPTDTPEGMVLFEGACVNLKQWSAAAGTTAQP